MFVRAWESKKRASFIKEKTKVKDVLMTLRKKWGVREIGFL